MRQSEDCREIFNAIAEFSGMSLVRLSIFETAFCKDSLDFSAAHKFKLLHELQLFGGSFDNFKLPLTLNTLGIYGPNNFSDRSWMSEAYPNLCDILFSFNFIEQFTNEVFIEFQASNPQLQRIRLHMIANSKITSSCLQGIGSRLPNLVDLQFNFCLNNGNQLALQQRLDEDVVHLSGLRHLRRLHGIGHFNRMSTSSVIDSLADNNVPIEDLTMDGFNPRIVDSLSRLTSIQSLQLDNFFTIDMILNLITNLPALNNLKIVSCKHGSLNGVKRILELSRNLKTLDFSDPNMLIDSGSMIESILDLARGRTRVKIWVIPSNICITLQTTEAIPDGLWMRIDLSGQ